MPTTIGRYHIERRLGAGAMGEVYRGTDPTLGRGVAIKLMLPHRVSATGAQKMRREAQALARLSHPHVVKVYEVGEHQGRTFIAMELIEGQTLAQWAQQQPPPSWREALRLYLQAGEGLAAAHAAGVIHRDFKPSNCMLGDDGRVVVLDFGIAKPQLSRPESITLEEPPGVDEADVELTREGAFVGTPAYAPLEQLRGQPLDERADQYSFCVSLYEAIYGQRPFVASSVAVLLLQLEQGPVDPPRRDVPAALHQALLRGLSKEPADRFAAMGALLDELRRVVASRRRGLTRAVLLGALVSAAGVGVWLSRPGDDRCDGAARHMDGAWDEPRAATVKAALLGTEVPYADQTWASVERGFDDYAARWVTKHAEVCQATRRGEQPASVLDLRMRCLQERRLALAQAVEVLGAASEATMPRAVRLATALPALSRCDDVEALRAQVPPPEDPEVAASVERVREQLARGRSLFQVGTYDQALAEAEPALARAEALAYPPALAEAKMLRGNIRSQQGRDQEAEQDLEQAYLLAVEQGHDTVVLHSALALAFIVGNRQARRDDGLRWARAALTLAEGPHGEPLDEALAWEHLGNVLDLHGEHEQALAYQRRALERFEGTLGSRHLITAMTLHNMGGTLLNLGRPDEALEHLQRAMSIKQELLGDEHPSIADSLQNIGGVLHQQGKVAQTLEYQRRALRILEGALGPEHRRVGDLLRNIGLLLKQQGALDEALEQLRRGLQILQATLGPGHPAVGDVLRTIGTVLHAQGRYEEALEQQRRGLQIQQEALGPRHPDVAQGILAVGITLAELGRQQEALEHYRRAQEIFEEALGPRHAHVGIAQSNVAGVLARQGDSQAAWEHYQRALDVLEESLGPQHPTVGHVLRRVAELALERRDGVAAREYAERAVSVMEGGEVGPDQRARARFLLARVLWSEPAQRPRALSLARQALEGLGEGADERAEVVGWLAEREAG